MPTREHLVLCGGVEGPKVLGRTTVRLDLHGPLANVKLSISDIARKLLVNIPDQLVDLLEIATYVYAADGAISRGGKTDSEMGARWRRTLRFKIPRSRADVVGIRAGVSGTYRDAELPLRRAIRV